MTYYCVKLRTQTSTITQFIQCTFHRYDINRDKWTTHVNVIRNYHIKSNIIRWRQRLVLQKKNRELLVMITGNYHQRQQKGYEIQTAMNYKSITGTCQQLTISFWKSTQYRKLSWIHLGIVSVYFVKACICRWKIMMASDLSTLAASVSEAVVIWVSFFIKRQNV